ncbi:hypothetical protein LR48_Vigan02g005400 [Vigna angularis]|uniref:Uncharacterized protein n=1 Tax=Phaseolus angularis TaxID=3914 RepID=A0A0L9TUQ3_PHAAN|nr:hypothetical protein LR48_Vigan02g005400 [Vigna angularis]
MSGAPPEITTFTPPVQKTEFLMHPQKLLSLYPLSRKQNFWRTPEITKFSLLPNPLTHSFLPLKGRENLPLHTSYTLDLECKKVPHMENIKT